MGSLACRAGENKKLLENATYGLSALKTILDAIEGSGFATGSDSLKVLSDVLDLIRTELTPEHQADASLDKASPVQNTWYTVLDTTLKAVVYCIKIAVGTTGETLGIRITVDGQTLTNTVAATAGTVYYCAVGLSLVAAGGVNPVISSTIYMAAGYSPLYARSIKVEVRKTTANGTGNLRGEVTYGKR